MAVHGTLVFRLLLLLLGVSGSEIGATQPREPVTFGGDPAYPPFEWLQQGQAVGFNVEMARAMGAASATEVRHRLADWPDTIEALKTGRVDVVPMFRSAERERHFWFSEPFYFAYHAIYTATDPGQVTGVAGLQRWRVAVERSSVAHDQLRSATPTMPLVPTGTTRAALEALSRGEADYAVLAVAPAEHLKRQLGLALYRVGAPLWPREYALAVRKDRTDVADWVRQSLDTVVSKGTFQKLLAQLEQKPPDRPKRWWEIAAPWTLGLIAPLLLFLYWRRRRPVGAHPKRPAGGDLRLIRDFESFGAGALFAVYQPQVDLRTGRIAAAEALVRWRHPAHGILSPSRFLPQLEEAGLISQVTARMTDEAVRLAVQMRARGWPCRISVNLSVRDLDGADIPSMVAETLGAHNAIPTDLAVELTESGAVENTDLTRRVLQQLKEMGLGIAIDDFGTGYSTLANLTELPFDELKIDRLFVSQLLSSANHRQVVRSTIEMAHRMGLTVVAEGAEDLATVAALGADGCDRVQGFAVSAALPPDEFLEFVATYNGAARSGG